MLVLLDVYPILSHTIYSVIITWWGLSGWWSNIFYLNIFKRETGQSVEQSQGDSMQCFFRDLKLGFNRHFHYNQSLLISCPSYRLSTPYFGFLREGVPNMDLCPLYGNVDHPYYHGSWWLESYLFNKQQACLLNMIMEMCVYLGFFACSKCASCWWCYLFSLEESMNRGRRTFLKPFKKGLNIAVWKRG